MTSGRTAHTGLCVFALALLFAACGDGGSEAPAPPAKGPTKAGAPSVRLIQPPAAVRDRLRTEVVASRAVPEVVTAPGEVALDLKQAKPLPASD